MKITIKHFNTEEQLQEANNYVKKAGLQKFNSLIFQYNRIPAGEYELDLDYIFSNQYNTKGKDGRNGFRVFEYSEPLSCGNGHNSPLGYGYYISEGIEEIRALQKQIKVCGYCGKQYLNTKKHFCTACLGSEYLKEENYCLLRLVELMAKDKFNYENVVLPQELIEKIKKAQYKNRLKRLKEEKASKLASIKKEIASSKKELIAFKWLIERDIDFKNVIYYSYTDTFSFGWRESLSEKEQEELYKKMVGFPYSWEITKKG